MIKEQYVQYGCGLNAPTNWHNFDASPTLRLQKIPFIFKWTSPRFPEKIKYGNIVKGLPLATESCKGIFCSHVIEHLSLNDCRVALKNTYSYLKPNGIFRLVLPDLEYLAHAYINSSDVNAAILFMNDSGLGRISRPHGVIEYLRDLFGNSSHYWMWDFKSLCAVLDDVGFCNIRRAELGDSEDILFNTVENSDRWANSLGIECRK